MSKAQLVRWLAAVHVAAVFPSYADQLIASDGVNLVWRSAGVADHDLPRWVDAKPMEPRPVDSGVFIARVVQPSSEIRSQSGGPSRDCAPILVDGRSVGGRSC